MDTGRIAVVGAGVIGLSTALCVSELVPRCSVTVVSDRFSPDTTSDVAAGMLIPHLYPGTPVPVQQRWFRDTFRHLSSIASSADAADTCVHLVSGWQIFRSVPTDPVPFWADEVLGFREMTEAELRRFPGHAFGQAFTTLKCEPSLYLPWLEKRFRDRGGLVRSQRVEDLWDLQPSCDIVVNCAGLGSRALAGDQSLSPVRGQVLRVRAPWLKHFLREDGGLTYIYPGASHVTLGGTRQRGQWSLCPDADTSRDILARCRALEPSLHGAHDVREKVGLRPDRPAPRLQTEQLARRGRRLPVVHHYGHGSGGVSVHWGCALDAARLVSEALRTLGTPAPPAKL
ncbi:D-aspartate oxidase isoform 1-T1 [Ctenodactylus gundi]